MAIQPTLDLSRAYTNEQRKSTADAYRRAMTDYYGTLYPETQRIEFRGDIGDKDPLLTKSKTGHGYYSGYYKTAAQRDDLLKKLGWTQVAGGVNSGKWRRNVGVPRSSEYGVSLSNIPQSDLLLNQYQQSYKANKPMTAGSRGSRRNAMSDYITGKVY